MKRFLEKQSANLFLWATLVVALGGALYFILPFEPVIKHPLIAVITMAIILLFGKINIGLRAIGIFLFGFLYSACFTHLLNTPQINYPLRDFTTDAYVKNLDFSSDKTRAILQIKIDDEPVNVRVTLPESGEPINIGDTLRISAGLFPPSGMDVPDTFDYARWAYFNNLGATGFISDYKIINKSNNINTNTTRAFIHNHAQSFLTDALYLGYKNALDQTAKQTWTNIGIAHVWSISGFHMTLVGGWLFLLFYTIFRSIGYITRRVPARIPATICAWVGLLFYLGISGFGIATLRAFLMTTLVFAAILFGRSVLSLRNVCIAFLIMFLINPHYILQPGFQLSFAAIFGITWYWNKDAKNVFIQDETQNKFLNNIKTALITTIVATVFTAPFIMAHFNSIPIYTLIGNLIFVPIFSIVIMPLVAIGTICALFNGHFVLTLCETLYNWMLNVASHIANFPYATITIPHISWLALTIITLGLFLLIFITPDNNAQKWIQRKLNYVLSGIFICIGIIVIVCTPKPVFYITPDHELIGMVYDGKLEFNKSRASNHYFAFNTFRKLNGEIPSDTNTRHKCDKGVCIYKSDNFTIAYIQKFVPLQKNLPRLCADKNIDYIASYFDIDSKTCANKILKNGFVIYKSGRIKYTPFNRYWNKTH